MVFQDGSQSIGGGLRGFGHGAATKAMMGMNPASTMPNYSVALGARMRGDNQPTYRQAAIGGQSDASSGFAPMPRNP